MDRALDEIVQENQKARRGGRGGRGPRRDDRRRDDVDRKSGRNGRDDRGGIDDDWIHDRYDDERGDIRGPRNRTDRNRSRRSPERERGEEGVKIRVENLHYDLTEDDLEDLFSRIAPISALNIAYDRAGRSTGTAYVTYRSSAPAKEAIREYDGANAHGQPIRLSIVPESRKRNPLDSAVQPGKSLFDRVQDGMRGAREGGSGRRNRSRSPRRSDVTRPAPENIDRYVPGERGDRSRSPPRRRRGGDRGGRGEGRRDGGRREDHGRTGEGARLPRKTQEELDREMDDYWGKKDATGAGASVPATNPAADSMEIEMAE